MRFFGALVPVSPAALVFPVPPPPVITYITAENGDRLTAENGDLLIKEG